MKRCLLRGFSLARSRQEEGMLGMYSRPVTYKEKVILRPVLSYQDKEDVANHYNKYYVHIKRYIASHISSAVDVEDLTQDVFAILCMAAVRKGGSGITRGYLFGIATNVIRNYIRHKRNSKKKMMPIDTIEEISSCSGITPNHNMAQMLFVQELEIMICELKTKLSPKVYKAVELNFFEGLTPEKAAQRIGCSVEAFKKRLQRGTRVLKQIIKKEATI